jgi:uncharacterized membrane protein
MAAHSYNRLAGQRLHRIEGLSDGVFAIAMTLLVLELRIPMDRVIHTEKELWEMFLDLKIELLTYFLSFMTLGIFWVGHSVQFQYIARSDRNLFWINIFLLMVVSLIPFTTSFLSRHIEFKLAIIIYWLNILLFGIIVYLHWDYVMRHNYAEADVPIPTVDKAIRKRIIVAQSLYAGGALLCFVNTYLSVFFIIAVQLNYAFALFEKRRK